MDIEDAVHRACRDEPVEMPFIEPAEMSQSQTTAEMNNSSFIELAEMPFIEPVEMSEDGERRGKKASL